MNEMFLLGAGASVDAGVPDSYDMTRQIAKHLSLVEGLRRFYRAINLLIGGLMMHKGASGGDPYEGVNIEDLLDAAEQLAHRHTLKSAPFVTSWHPLVETVDGLESETLLSVFAADIRAAIDVKPSDFDDLAVNALARTIAGRLGSRVFRKLPERMVVGLKALTHIEDASSVDYLLPLVHLAESMGALTVATLNYDNSVELAAQSASVHCDTGLGEWAETGFVGKRSREGLLLLKLHGSIDWARQRRRSDKGTMGHERFRAVGHDEVMTSKYLPAIIFGGGNKLTAEGPFLAILEAFQRALVGSRRLTVVGYSFRDPHINEYLTRWLNAGHGTMRIVDPGFGESHVPYARELREYCSDKIEVILKPARDGLSTCCGDSGGIPGTGDSGGFR